MRNPQNDKKIYFGENVRQLCAFYLISRRDKLMVLRSENFWNQDELAFFPPLNDKFLKCISNRESRF